MMDEPLQLTLFPAQANLKKGGRRCSLSGRDARVGAHWLTWHRAHGLS